MLAFIHNEAAQEYDQTRQALETLNNQLQLANRAASRFRVNLPNKEEAITQLSRAADGANAEAKPFIGIFVADAVSALQSRYGREVSEHLLDEVSRKNILPLMPDGKLFRWSGHSVAVIWHSPKSIEEVLTPIANACKAPFDCKAFIGTRTATFRIAVRSVVLQAQGDPAELIRFLDRFVEGTNAR